jgi:hypothetical protein
MTARPTSLLRTACVAILALPATLVVQVAAESSAHAMCPPDYWYSIVSSSSYHIPAAGQYFKDGPGGTMTASVTASSTISASGTVTAGATVSGIVAEAKLEVSATIGTSQTITVGHTYSHTITPGKYGNMQYGSWGYKLSWEYWRDNGNCTSTRLSSGTNFTAPTNAVGWRYWETT